MRKLYGIQYLRAFAALAVVACHAAVRIHWDFGIGAAGVDVFFVVSGFIMWVIARGDRVSPGRFFGNRLRRVVPIYWLATVVVLVGAMLGFLPNVTLTPSHVLESFFFIPHHSPSHNEMWPLLIQGWTLNYEMFFYAVFAGILFLHAKVRLLALATPFIGLTCLGLLVDSQNPIFLTYTNPIILEFLIGALAGKLWLDGAIPTPGVGFGLVAAGILGFAFVGIRDVGDTPFVFGPLAAALVVGTLALERGGALRHMRLLAYLGDGSYSIYLWHTMGISVALKLSGLLFLTPLQTFAFTFVAGIAVGIAAYELLEKPLARAFSRRTPVTVRGSQQVAIV